MFISLSLSSIDICPVLKYLVKKCTFEMVEISCNFVNRLYCFSKSIRNFFRYRFFTDTDPAENPHSGTVVDDVVASFLHII